MNLFTSSLQAMSCEHGYSVHRVSKTGGRCDLQRFILEYINSNNMSFCLQSRQYKPNIIYCRRHSMWSLAQGHNYGSNPPITGSFPITVTIVMSSSVVHRVSIDVTTEWLTLNQKGSGSQLLSSLLMSLMACRCAGEHLQGDSILWIRTWSPWHL